jgi:hypothetical protein
MLNKMNKLFININIIKKIAYSDAGEGGLLCRIMKDLIILAYDEDFFFHENSLILNKSYKAYFENFSQAHLIMKTKKKIELNSNSGIKFASGPIIGFYDKKPIINIGFPVLVNTPPSETYINKNMDLQITAGVRVVIL